MLRAQADWDLLVKIRDIVKQQGATTSAVKQAARAVGIDARSPDYELRGEELERVLTQLRSTKTARVPLPDVAASAETSGVIDDAYAALRSRRGR